MCICISFTDFYHFLQRIQRGSHQQRVIRITENSKKGSLDPAATSVLPENVEKFVHVKTVGEPAQDCPLPDTIGHTEAGGELIVPADVGKLVDVDEY